MSCSRREFAKSMAAAGSLAAMPVFWSTACRRTDPSSTRYDLLVYGTTPGGVACAVRAAREGLKVLMISHNDRVGGMLTSGLGVWDTLYEGYRSPIYNELRQSFFDHYRTHFGEDSEAYKRALPGESGHNNGTFEAHVAEKYVNEMVAGEKNITVLFNHYPSAAGVEGREIRTLTLKKRHGRGSREVKALYFADCSYEGDLMKVAGLRYRVGREAKAEFNEAHAGKVFMRPLKQDPRPGSRESRIFSNLKIRHFGGHQEILYPESTHEGDNNVQAYNMRYYITDDAENQISIEPSSGYDPGYLSTLEFAIGGEMKPNRKLGTNRPQLVGMHQDYVEGDWETRQDVIDEHLSLIHI